MLPLQNTYALCQFSSLTPVIRLRNRQSFLCVSWLYADYGQAACLLCFDKFRPFLQAYCLSDRCNLCCFILHNATSRVQRTPIYYMELFGVFWNVQFTPSGLLEFIIHHWTAGGKTRNILLLHLKINVTFQNCNVL